MTSPRLGRRRLSVVGQVLIVLIGAYQATLSKVMPSQCRFYPSCSHYSLEAIRTHGAFRGGWLALRRVGRCHPFHPGGLDPVPPR